MEWIQPWHAKRLFLEFRNTSRSSSVLLFVPTQMEAMVGLVCYFMQILNWNKVVRI